MTDTLQSECQAFVAAFVRLDEAEKLGALADAFDDALSCGPSQRLYGIAVGLRENGLNDWAERAFTQCRRIPELRHGALFEASVLAWLRGAPQEAVDLLDRMEADGPLNGYQHREFAHRLILTGDAARAEAHLEQAVLLEPAAFREGLAYRQLLDFMTAFPRREAVARGRALPAVYPLRSPAEIADDVASALASCRPYSLVRLNDGEGALLRLGIADEARWSELYARMRRDFHVGYWFGDDSMVEDRDFLEAAQAFNAMLPDADCLAGYTPAGLDHAYAMGSVRNVPACFNVVRKLEQLAATDGFVPGRVTLADGQINQTLMSEDRLAPLLASQTRIGLVSCHDALPGALAERFGLREVLFHKTPGEALISGSRREPFGQWHGRLSAELARAEPGVLYLVAAGIPGKIYCDLIKKAGGVALDIGAVADVWMRAPTRRYFHDVSGYALTA